MARRTRPARQKGDPSRPNTVLVILLVLFFLSTAGLGGWVYSMFNDRLKYEDAVKKVEKEKTGLNKDLVFAQGVSYAWRAMMGDPAFNPKDAETDEYKTLKAFLQSVDENYAVVVAKETAEGEQAKLSKEDQEIKSLKLLLKSSQDELGWNADSFTYKSTYRDVTPKLREAAEKAKIDAKGFLPDKLATEALLASLETKFKKDRKDAFSEIQAGNTKSFNKAKEVGETMDAAIAAGKKKLDDFIAKVDNQYKKDLQDKDRKIKEYKDKLDAQGVATEVVMAPPPLTKDKEMKGGGTNVSYAGVPHALMLDISKGKTLWDVPRGKIIRVEEKERRVFIDKGAENGMRVQMTFNVFGAGWDNRAEKMLKGTLEIVRVEAKMSEARVTSLYDPEGREIAVGDQAPGKLLRESGNPLKEGDLLFNLAWGSHVAIAGVIDWNGQDSQSPAGQAEDVEQFRNLLRAQGIIVDCYIDLRDGKTYGSITPRTNYLIRGFGYGGLPKEKMTDAMTAANEGVAALRKEAVERGLFVISPENFGLVIGYRRPASALSTATLDFQPSLPSGGGLGGPVLPVEPK